MLPLLYCSLKQTRMHTRDLNVQHPILNILRVLTRALTDYTSVLCVEVLTDSAAPLRVTCCEAA